MEFPQEPQDELARLTTLRRYQILDTPGEIEFDDTTLLASSICDTPISLITFLDEERQWFKSKVGLDATETPRKISFCGHALLADTIFEIPDAREDPRFYDNPLVTGYPNIRFYAGAPLITSDGFRLGTLCVIDHTPRTLNERQRKALEALARQVVRQMESRAMAVELAEQSRALERSEQLMQTLIENLPVGVYTKRLRKIDVDDGGVFLIWNRAAEEMTGIAAASVLGRANRAVFPGAMAQVHAEHDRLLLETSAPITVPVYPVRRPDGTTRLLRMTSVPLFDAAGDVEYTMGIAEDITDLLCKEKELRARKAELEAVNDASPLGLFHADTSGAVTYVNRAFEAMSGLTNGAALGLGWCQAIHPLDAEKVAASWFDATSKRLYYDNTQRFLHADGTIVLVRAQAAPIIVDGVLTGFVGTVDDITARRAASAAIAESELRLRTITDNMPGAITYIDRDHRFQFANATMYEWTATTPEAVLGKLVRELLGEDHYAERVAFLDRAFAGERVEFMQTSNLGQQIRYLQSTYVPDIAPDGSVRGIYTLSHDITALKETEEELRRIARFDSLTGLPNRSHLYEMLDRALERAKRQGTAMAVLFLDIDHFKSINDTLGHIKGDLVLQEFARRLEAAVRTTDAVARLAGDEFIVILECVKTAQHAENVARKILAAIARPWLLNGDRLSVTTSIGVAFDTSHAHSGMALIGQADEALYKAKSAGRDQFHIQVC